MTGTDIKLRAHCLVMAQVSSQTRVTVTLPPSVAERLAAEVKQGRYPSMEEAVLAGAKLVAGLGPRAKELLREGAGADEFVRADQGKDQGDWL
jgi:Arc/MetJ-type ribon-helix-helix transcriptional regulator